VLEGLNDIVTPESIPLVPQTIGWLVLLIVVIVATLAIVVVVRRRYRRNAYRREALEIVNDTPLAELPALVKRVALVHAPRSDIAALTGDEWLQYLDRSYGGNGFTEGPGRILATLSFDPSAAAQVASTEELRALISTWVRKHDV
jgi:Ca-activated chloride channel family protein